MFVTLKVFLEADQVAHISGDPDNMDGIIVEVFEADEKTYSQRLHLSTKEIVQISKAMQSVDDLRKV
jgi:hypothetical protein